MTIPLTLRQQKGSPLEWSEVDGNFTALRTGIEAAAVSSSAGGFRNKIINGKMEIDQRNAGALVTVNTDSANVYSVDRWAGLATPATGVFTLDQEAGPFATASWRYPFALRVNVTTARASLAAGDRFLFGQVIEGFNVSDLNYGFSTAREVTLSFEVFSPLTGTYCVSLRNSAVNRSYVAEYTVSQANTWERKTITIPGDTAGTWLTDNGVGIRLYWSLGAGSSQRTTAGAWQAGNFIATANQVNFMSSNSGRTMFITGVQLEPGSVATPFEHRPIGAELALCQRYHEFTTVSVITGAASQSMLMTRGFSQTKRSTPTLAPTSSFTHNVSNISFSTLNLDAFRAVLSATSGGAAEWTGSVVASSEL